MGDIIIEMYVESNVAIIVEKSGILECYGKWSPLQIVKL